MRLWYVIRGFVGVVIILRCQRVFRVRRRGCRESPHWSSSAVISDISGSRRGRRHLHVSILGCIGGNVRFARVARRVRAARHDPDGVILERGPHRWGSAEETQAVGLRVGDCGGIRRVSPFGRGEMMVDELFEGRDRQYESFSFVSYHEKVGKDWTDCALA